MSGPALLVMAGGLGSRFGGLKQVEPVGPSGELVIDYSIHDALQAGFSKVIFLIREEMLALFRERVGRRVEARVDTVYAFQRLEGLPAGFSLPEGRTKPWGTAHAVLSCRAVADRPFAAINADDFYGREAFDLLARYLANLNDAPGSLQGCMAGYVLGNTLSEYGSVARGVCAVSPQGWLQDVHEHLHIERRDGQVQTSQDAQAWSALDERTIVSMNMWGLTPNLFAELSERFPVFLRSMPNPVKSEFFLPNVVGTLIHEGRMQVRVLPTEAHWFGVTYPADLPRVRESIAGLVRAGDYPARLWQEA